ncbi:hypothetical protein Lesp02_10820 [Lentzea sp. NBRC 105346]|uniref:hypothetical protein n=1 Tax=Lentzea sp. NBRC 105346 TaxID=3032205 RepID=UPI0024A48904|nr:hypothetical protein [Lentzea sp. NBRC 105346]GLZ28892.1 hypothetical protein Lesp02_10820 [Lentzea sp. NBRC 105346]
MTDVVGRIESALDDHRGPVALVGPWGSGKSTELRRWLQKDDGDAIAVLIEVEVRYEPLAFLSGLYALLADAAAGRVKKIPALPDTRSLTRVTHDLYKLILRVGRTTAIRIAVDDVTRIAPEEHVVRFLNDVLPVLSAPGCRAVLAIGTEVTRRPDVRAALAGRVRPVELAEPTLAETSRLVHNVIVGVPEQQIAILYAITGGVPRAMMRALRDLDVPLERRVREALLGVDSPLVVAFERTVLEAASREWDNDLAHAFDRLAGARRTLESDPSRAAGDIAAFRAAWGLWPLDLPEGSPVTRPEPVAVVEPPVAERRHPVVELLERERLPQLIGEALDTAEAKRAIRRAELDRSVLAAELAASALVRENVKRESERLHTALLALPDSRPRRRRWWQRLDRRLFNMGISASTLLAGNLVGGAVALLAEGLVELLDRLTPPDVDSELDGLTFEWERAVLADGVMPAMRAAINLRLEPLEWLSLVVTDTPGLVHAQDDKYTVDTESLLRFAEAEKRVREGAIGLAGPRGSGKSALLLRHTRDAPNRIACLVSAPVRYEPRDFVLHLYGELCLEVIRVLGGQGARDHPDWPGLVARRARNLRLAQLCWVLLVTAAVLGVAYVGVGVALGFSGPMTALRNLIGTWWFLPGLALAVAGAANIGLWVLRWTGWTVPWQRVGAALGAFGERLKWPRPKTDEELLVRLAEQDLKQIRFLQTHTTGWSGKLTVPVKADLTVTRSTQLAQRPLTHPELVDRLRRFLDRVVATLQPKDDRPAVVIAIDELDKVEAAEDAHRFVNEIKGVFGVPGCQFLVSVSEEALTVFERRGLALRDAFDSAFDEIVRVGYLSLRDAHELLQVRVIGMSEPFRYLCHALSGGLPRELIRVARTMAALAGPDVMPSLGEVAERIVVDELRRRATSIQEVAAQLGTGPDVAEFVRTIHACVANPTPVMLLRNAPAAQEGDTPLARLRLESRVYLRYVATLLQVFDNRLDRPRLKVAGAVPDDPGSFDSLTTVPQRLAAHPMLAAVTLDEFRRAWRLDEDTGPPEFKLDASERLLAERVRELPEHLRPLCHCLSGGTPHALIRLGRKAKELDEGQVVRRLVHDELRDRTAHIREAVLKLGLGPDVAALKAALDASDASGLAAGDGTKLGRLREEFRAHARFAETVLCVFEADLECDFDLLATVPHLLATDVARAVATLDQVRAAW